MIDTRNSVPRGRRRFLAGVAGLTVAPLLPLRGSAQSVREPALVQARLSAAALTTQVVPKEYPQTEVWTYNASLPGPVLRVRQGDRLRVHVENHLAESTTVHWHGVRLPNAMDGVPFITQRPIEPGAEISRSSTTLTDAHAINRETVRRLP